MLQYNAYIMQEGVQEGVQYNTLWLAHSSGQDFPIMSIGIMSDVQLCLATCQKTSRKY